MDAHACLNNEFTEDEKYHNLMMAYFFFRSRSEHPKLKLIPELLKYPCVSIGSSTILKVDLKNGYLEDVKVSGEELLLEVFRD